MIESNRDLVNFLRDFAKGFWFQVASLAIIGTGEQKQVYQRLDECLPLEAFHLGSK